VGVTVIALIAGARILHPAAHTANYQPLLQGANIPADIDAIVTHACQDCHSNKTEWPWYAEVPPMSILIEKDVDQGRAFMNLSNWQAYSKGQKLGYLMAMSNAATTGEMPPRRYTMIHGDARLTPEQRQRLADWAKQESAQLVHPSH
jgi:uncharacterized membrane protein